MHRIALAYLPCVVIDEEVPVINECPNSTVSNTDPGLATGNVTWTHPYVTDNSNTSTALESSHDPGFSFPIGTTEVNYTAADSAGNTAVVCYFNVTINGKNLSILLLRNIFVIFVIPHFDCFDYFEGRRHGRLAKGLASKSAAP